MTRVNIAREITTPAFDYATYYRFSWHATYCYFDFLTYLLSFIFGVFWSGKITLTLYLWLLLAATRSLLKSISAPLFPFILWPMLFAYNWWFWIGSINLLAGFCVGIYAIGLVWKKRGIFEHKNGRLFPPLCKLLFLLMLCAACHPISLLLSVLVVLPLGISSRFKNGKRTIALSIYVLFVIALEIAGHIYFHQPWEMLTNLGRTQWMLHDFYAPPTQARVFKIAFLIVLCLWLFTKKKDIIRCFFLPAFLALLVLLTPHSIGISGDNDLRCGFFAFLLAPFFVPSPSKKIWTITISLLFLCCGLYWNIEQIKKQLSYNSTYLEIERIAQQAPAAPRVRPLCANAGLPDQQAAAYITFFRGGFFPFLFASPFHGLAYLKRPACVYPESFNKLDPHCAEFYNCLIVYKNEGNEAFVKESELSSMGFSKRCTGTHFDCYLR